MSYWIYRLDLKKKIKPNLSAVNFAPENNFFETWLLCRACPSGSDLIFADILFGTLLAKV
jgi:hypothetical protein